MSNFSSDAAKARHKTRDKEIQAFLDLQEGRREEARDALRIRWYRWQDQHGSEAITTSNNGDHSECFGVRGDGATILFDDQGYFLIRETGPGEDPTEPGRTVPSVYRLFSADEELVADAHIEPIEIAGLHDAIQDNYS